MTTPHEPDYTALFKAYLIEPKDNLRAKLIQAVSYHEGWEESAVCMVDEAIMPVFTALLSDSATVEAAFQKAMQKLGKPDDEFNQWHMEEGNIRAVLYDTLQAIKEMVG